MDNVLGCVLMAAVTFPISFWMARSCLRVVIRMVTVVPSLAPGGGQKELSTSPK